MKNTYTALNPFGNTMPSFMAQKLAHFIDSGETNIWFGDLSTARKMKHSDWNLRSRYQGINA